MLLALTGLALASCADDNADRTPEIIVAYMQPPADPRAGPDLVVLNATTDERHVISNEGTHWSDLAWSPDGAYLAGISGPRGQEVVSIFTREDWSVRTIPLERDVTSRIEWAFDSTRLALHGLPLTIFSAEGEVLAESTGIPADPAGGGGTGSIHWSPDSRHVAADINQHNVVLWEDGTTDIIGQREPVPPPGPPGNGSVVGWRDSSTVLIDGADAPEKGLTHGTAVFGMPFPERNPAYGAAVEAIATPPGETEPVLVRPRLTADGTAVVATYLWRDDREKQSPLVIRAGDETTVLDLQTFRGRASPVRFGVAVVVLNSDAPRLTYSLLPE